MSRLRLVAVLVGSSLAMAGCATAPPPSAVVEYARTDCAAAPDLSTAIGLTPAKEKAEHIVTRPLNAESPCVADPRGARPYLVYAMPADPGDKTLTVGGVLEAARILAPEVSTLDGAGQVIRTFPPGEFYFRGHVYSVQFRPREGEAYLLVTVDPGRVGQQHQSIAVGTNTSTTYVAGVGPVSFTTGAEAHATRTYSYEGSVEVTVNDSDVKKKN